MGWDMGWHVDDAHRSIHDDGRTLRPVREDEFVGVYDDFGHRDLERPHDARAAFVFRGGKLIPDTVYIHPDRFLITGWESHYSDVFASESPKFHYEASFAPVVDDSWRVVGHVGWADGCDICVPGETVQKGSKFWDILAERRLGEWRQRWLDDADRFDHALPAFGPRSAPKPPPRDPRWKPSPQDEARRGPFRDPSSEFRYLHNLDYFVKGGGKALVGTYTYMEIERANNLKHSWYAPYLDLKVYGSSGYRFQVLVSPDGYLQAVLGIDKVRPKTRGDKIISDVLEGIDIAMTVLMIIDIITIPVALFRLGALVAEKASIRAVEVVIDREAKEALKLAELEARRAVPEVIGRMAGTDAAADAFWAAGEVAPRQFTKAEEKAWTAKVADRMKKLGIPKENIGIRGIPGESGEAFTATGSSRGANVRGRGISVHGNVEKDWVGFPEWNAASVDTRIDASIAHEWMEFNELTHWETVELATESRLRISKEAKELLAAMQKRGRGWKALVDKPRPP